MKLECVHPLEKVKEVESAMRVELCLVGESMGEGCSMKGLGSRVEQEGRSLGRS